MISYPTDLQSQIQLWLSVIGSIWLFSIALKVLSEFWIILRSNEDVQKKYGQNCWAIVTGATDGIGKGFCQQLAVQGVNVCLIARNKEKAQSLVTILKSLNSGAQFQIVISDFTNCVSDTEFFDKIYSEVKNLDIGLLVNNVGVAETCIFHELPEDQVMSLISLNCFPIVLLTQKLLPLMLKRRSKSGIINLSSFGGTQAIPFISVYSATKAFDDYFSRSVAQEYEGKLDIMSLRPFYVTTAMTKFNKGAAAINIDQCAKGALGRIGLTSQTCGHWRHRLLFLIMSILPDAVRKRFIRMGMKVPQQRKQS